MSNECYRRCNDRLLGGIYYLTLVLVFVGFYGIVVLVAITDLARIKAENAQGRLDKCNESIDNWHSRISVTEHKLSECTVVAEANRHWIFALSIMLLGIAILFGHKITSSQARIRDLENEREARITLSDLLAM